MPNEAEVAIIILAKDEASKVFGSVGKTAGKMGGSVAESAKGFQLLSKEQDKALKTMRQDAPDVVLLDIMMSYILDGLDVSREMAGDPELQHIPVIMVTSLTGVKETSMLPGDEYIPADEWLAKPIDPDELLSRIDEALA